jgi:hypothetical protein
MYFLYSKKEIEKMNRVGGENENAYLIITVKFWYGNGIFS